MRRASVSRGYTIVEVMLFLAISGFMFLIAAIFVQGKQSSAEFRQSMNSITNDIQRVINDVTNGFYPSNSDFVCNGGNPPTLFAVAPGSQEQGTNQGCVFAGKFIQFGVGGTDRNGYNVYSLAANRLAGEVAPRSFDEANPVVIYDKNADPPAFDLTEYETLDWGLKVTAVRYMDGGSPRAINGFGFFQSLGRNESIDAEVLVSGSQTVVVVPIEGGSPSSLNRSAPDMITDIESYLQSSSSTGGVPRPDITICFEGRTGQHGMVKVGGTSGRLNVTQKILNSQADCV